MHRRARVRVPEDPGDDLDWRPHPAVEGPGEDEGEQAVPRLLLPMVTLELSKLGRMEMLDGTFMTGEVTRKQRRIVEALGVDLERLCA